MKVKVTYLIEATEVMDVEDNSTPAEILAGLQESLTDGWLDVGGLLSTTEHKTNITVEELNV